jgi:hypothetical protein
MRASCSARYLWRQGVGLVPDRLREVDGWTDRRVGAFSL